MISGHMTHCVFYILVLTYDFWSHDTLRVLYLVLTYDLWSNDTLRVLYLVLTYDFWSHDTLRAMSRYINRMYTEIAGDLVTEREK